MMSDFDLSITICSWNTVVDLRICLKSLELVRDEASFEVIVVDNNSEDGSAEMVASEFSWVCLERQTQNLGFTGGHNLALNLRRGRHALLLNSDTIVHAGAIQKTLEYLCQNDSVGIVGPKLLNPDGSLQLSCRRFPNPVAALFRNTPIGKLFPNNRFTREYLMTDWDHNSPREVDWVSGAAFLVRDEVIERVGSFDPAYFMYCEDVDWCFRVWKAGFKVVYLPSAEITHAIGRSTDKAPNRMIGRFHRSMFRFFTKNIVPEMIPLMRPIATFGAATALMLRAGFFISMNRVDDMRRKANRQ